MAKTFDEMFREVYGHRADRCFRTARDKLLYNNSTFQSRCSGCGRDTVPLELPHQIGDRVCVSCLIEKALSGDYVELSSEELHATDDLRDRLYSVERESEDLKRQLEMRNEELKTLRSNILSLKTDLAEKMDLIAEISEECEDLRKRVDSFDDDSTAIRNENARLKLDLQKMKDVMAQRKRIGG
jgi:septal ring factor EnvC (AmiA/AmiB activator)